MKRLLAALALTLAASYAAAGSVPRAAEGLSDDPKTTPAYGVLVLRKAALEAESADLSSRFTDESEEVRTKRFELSAIAREMGRMQRIGKARAQRLSDTYGNLVLSKVALEVELNGLVKRFTPEHPDVKKKRAELAAMERELKNILD